VSTTFYIVAGALLALLLAFLAFGPRMDDLNPWELHHGYWGALAIALAAPLGWSWLAWLGFAALLDDTWQHGVQRLLRRPRYRSPGHRLYGLFYDRLAWLRALNRTLE